MKTIITYAIKTSILLFLIFASCKKENIEDIAEIENEYIENTASNTTYISASPLSQTLCSDTVSTKIEVSSNTSWAISTHETWCTAYPSSGENNKTITIKCFQNASIKNRTAIISITISGKNPFEIEITQEGAKIDSIDFNGTLYVYPINNANFIAWYSDSATITGATGTTDGKANTASIIANQKVGAYAAYICDTLNSLGYSDWYLPAKDELNAIYVNRSTISEIGTYIYWSSTENSKDQAWYQSLSNGIQSKSYGKNANLSVRCVRR